MIKEQLFRYEFADASHYKDILILWKESSAWGELAEDTLKKWISAPYEPCEIAICKNESNQLVGMCFLIPTRITTPKGLVKGIKVFAPVFRKDLQGANLLNINHPMNQLFDFAFKHAKRRSVELIYMNPFVSWIRILEVSHKYGLPHFSISTYNFCKVFVPEADFSSPYQFEKVERFTKKHEKLWQTSIDCSSATYAINRSLNWLNYKGEDCIKIQVSLDEKLIGLLIYHEKQKLIYDFILAPNVDKHNCAAGAVHFLKSNEFLEKGFVKIVNTSNFKEFFEQFTIEEIPFDFVFAVASISERFTYQDLVESKWYLTSMD